MIALIQRVAQAQVEVDGCVVAGIDAGLLALVCAERHDTEREADGLADKVLRYRVFADDAGRMNRSLLDTGGALLAVPQFTLAADTQSGTRPSFTPAALPQDGRRLFERFVEHASSSGLATATGTFGAHMRVSLVNDGPVTFWLRIAPRGLAARKACA